VGIKKRRGEKEKCKAYSGDKTNHQRSGKNQGSGLMTQVKYKDGFKEEGEQVHHCA
jgi:hypothetical protein